MLSGAGRVFTLHTGCLGVVTGITAASTGGVLVMAIRQNGTTWFLRGVSRLFCITCGPDPSTERKTSSQTRLLNLENFLLKLRHGWSSQQLLSSGWATVCKTVRPMLSDRCPVCLSVLCVTVVYCGQRVGWIKIKLGMQVGLGTGHMEKSQCESKKFDTINCCYII